MVAYDYDHVLILNENSLANTQTPVDKAANV
jgi:hypothetical protein